MQETLPKTLEILERTPAVLQQLLQGLSDEWTSANEGGNSWSAYQVVQHLIHAEQTDWMVRTEQILSSASDKAFRPFDREGGFYGHSQTLPQLLAEFATLRERNLQQLRQLNLTPADLQKTGMHPAFGEVTLSQLLSTWAVHDLGHIGQIVRVMAWQYQEAVGPWETYLGILQRS